MLYIFVFVFLFSPFYVNSFVQQCSHIFPLCWYWSTARLEYNVQNDCQNYTEKYIRTGTCFRCYIFPPRATDTLPLAECTMLWLMHLRRNKSVTISTYSRKKYILLYIVLLCYHILRKRNNLVKPSNGENRSYNMCNMQHEFHKKWFS